MQGFNAVPTLSKKDQLTLRLTSVMEEIRSRQLKKHKVTEHSELVEQATATFKQALVERLVDSLESSPCHLRQEYRRISLERITGL